MQVIEVARFGGPEMLVAGRAADPVAGAGQVVVAVAAADVLFLDTQIRAGQGEYFGVTPPYVPGNGVAGQVISVGEDVDSAWLGRRVVTVTAAATPEGGYAERAVANAAELVPVPDGLDLQRAVALLHDGPTALTLMDGARLRPGRRVLVTGAGGGMGILLVQLAVAAGARVVAAARGEAKLDLARSLGAEAVNYAAPGWTARALRAADVAEGGGFDVVLDGVGGRIGRDAFRAVATGGRFSAHGAPSGSFAQIDAVEAEQRSVTVRGIEQVRFAPSDTPPLIRRALAETTAGRLAPVIGRTFPLARATDAHRQIEARTVVGKTLLLT
jgi:NADPH2:quinone reductase